MINNKSGESLIGIIIGIFILGFIMLGITNLLINNKININNNKTKNIINILKNNTNNIISKIDISKIDENEYFYLNKNISSNKYEIFTGSTNENYKYIDQYGNNISDISNFNGDIFKRTLYVEKKDDFLGKNHQIITININKIIKN